MSMRLRSFQPGDVRVQIKGEPFTLRLTLGALAQISGRLSASSPGAFSSILRTLSPEQARVLLSCLSCPPLMQADGSAGIVSDADIQRLLPDICRVFENAFSSEGNK